MPTPPGRTTLANPRATPPTCAVPQSGPITSTSAAAAASLSRTSSSTETLSENSITLMPDAMASKASVTACWPGTEITARLAPERAAARPERARGDLVVTAAARVAGATQCGQGVVDRRKAGVEHVGVVDPQSDDEVVRPGLRRHVEAHATQHVDVELGGHRDLGGRDAGRAGDGARHLHQAHRVVIGAPAQLHVAGHAALPPVACSSWVLRWLPWAPSEHPTPEPSESRATRMPVKMSAPDV